MSAFSLLRLVQATRCSSRFLRETRGIRSLSAFNLRHGSRLYSTETEPSTSTSTTTTSPHHTIIRESEKVKDGGSKDKREFQAETRMLLDIVAKSLYSDSEVFIRELISNSSDALEKFRFSLHADSEKVWAEADRVLEIHIGTDKQRRQLIIQDTGIGMTRDELVENLGTIARSGSKKFLEEIKEKTDSSSVGNIIGQFGVGFYSAFMVADQVEVYTRSSTQGEPGYRWTSDGSGSYEIQEAEGVAVGTKIVMHLKPDCREYSDEDRVRAIIKKYSNFVGSAIYLNGKQVNHIQPVWLKSAKEVTPEEHNEFYRFIGNSFDTPRFILHYKADVPLNICALLYIPEGKPGLFDLSRDGDQGLALYTRKILIQSKTDQLLPKWLRFVKGVVDSEDIPLNLSRELLQNSSLIKKLRNVLTNRLLRYLQERSQKEPEEFAKFYTDYGLFLKEGIITSEEHRDKEEIAKLLRFDSSANQDGETGPRVTLPEYVNRKAEGQKEIYYLAAPSRALAETSPYYEGIRKRNVEVLFCYEPYDELVLMQLQTFLGTPLVSVEKEMREDRDAIADVSDYGPESLLKVQIDELVPWIKGKLAGRVATVKVTKRLETHPCVVSVEEMAAARHFIRTQSHQVNEANRFALLQPQLEINPKHTIIKKLYKLSKDNEELATLIVEQLFNNSMVAAGLADDPRTLLLHMNDLMTKILEKY